jgi:hypothetical protein
VLLREDHSRCHSRSLILNSYFIIQNASITKKASLFQDAFYRNTKNLRHHNLSSLHRYLYRLTIYNFTFQDL